MFIYKNMTTLLYLYIVLFKNTINKRITNVYFQNHDAVFIAEDLIGKTLVRQFETGEIIRAKIIETEAYVGPEDLACHASKGKTPRTSIMFDKGGTVYVY